MPNRNNATMPPFRVMEAASFQKHAEAPAALALARSQRAAVALIGDASILAQPRSAACRTSGPLGGDRGQASPLHLIRSGFMRMFGHAALLSVSPAVSETMKDSQEFHGFFP